MAMLLIAPSPDSGKGSLSTTVFHLVSRGWASPLIPLSSPPPLLQPAGARRAKPRVKPKRGAREEFFIANFRGDLGVRCWTLRVGRSGQDIRGRSRRQRRRGRLERLFRSPSGFTGGAGSRGLPLTPG